MDGTNTRGAGVLGWVFFPLSLTVRLQSALQAGGNKRGRGWVSEVTRVDRLEEAVVGQTVGSGGEARP